MSEPRLKLYLVRCRGMQATLSNHQAHGVAYVVAPDAAQAYQRVREHLDENDLGFDAEREMAAIELVADVAEYPGCGVRLYLPKESR